MVVIRNIIKKKGYKYTKQYDKFEVKVEDLPYSSHYRVDLKCDSCGEMRNITYQSYNENLHEDGKYYCRNCSKKLFGFIKMKNTLLQNGKNSFAQYLIDTYGDNALELYWDYKKNKSNPWEINKCTDRLKIWIKCQEKSYHGSYETNPAHFTHMNSRCPFCSHKSGKVHPFDSFGKILEDKNLLWVWSDKNKKSPYEYSQGSGQKAWFKCLNQKHKDYKREIRDLTVKEFRCPECVKERTESILQEKVRLYLESLNNGEFTILHERGCTIIPQNPKIKNKRGRLPFDNEVKELKLIIEVHGMQHYKELYGQWFNPNFDLHHQQLLDRYKKFIAYKQGYYYIEIPYWTDNKKEIWKDIINNKINEITERIVI